MDSKVQILVTLKDNAMSAKAMIADFEQYRSVASAAVLPAETVRMRTPAGERYAVAGMYPNDGLSTEQEAINAAKHGDRIYAVRLIGTVRVRTEKVLERNDRVPPPQSSCRARLEVKP